MPSRSDEIQSDAKPGELAKTNLTGTDWITERKRRLENALRTEGLDLPT